MWKWSVHNDMLLFSLCIEVKFVVKKTYFFEFIYFFLTPISLDPSIYMEHKGETLPGSTLHVVWGKDQLVRIRVNVLVYLQAVGVVSHLTCSFGDGQTRVARRGVSHPPSVTLRAKLHEWWIAKLAPGLEPLIKRTSHFNQRACILQCNMTQHLQTQLEEMVKFLEQGRHHVETKLEEMLPIHRRKKWLCLQQRIRLELAHGMCGHSIKMAVWTSYCTSYPNLTGK